MQGGAGGGGGVRRVNSIRSCSVWLGRTGLLETCFVHRQKRPKHKFYVYNFV